jgi:hypothetical protein
MPNEYTESCGMNACDRHHHGSEYVPSQALSAILTLIDVLPTLRQQGEPRNTTYFRMQINNYYLI